MKHGIAKIQCKCAHAFQDEKYGKQVRIANSTAKQDNTYVEVRCTVCGTTQRINPSQVK
jgi:RNase P subunit RPR2